MLQAVPNFRDLAGIACDAGRVLRPGQILRSSLLTELTPQDLQQLARYPVRWVCDLRSPEERALLANHWPAPHSVATLTADDARSPDAVRPAAWHERLRDPDFDAEAARGYMQDAYRRMPLAYASLLARLFELLDRGDAAPLLIHCVAGKDRTGFVCALILWTLGASMEAIRADYLASHVFATRMGSLLAHGSSSGDLPMTPRAVQARAVIAGVDSDFLDAAWFEIARSHATLDAYLFDVAGVDDARRQRLRDRLLERP